MEANEYVGLDEDWVDGYPELSTLIKPVKYIQIVTFTEMSNTEVQAIWNQLFSVLFRWANESGNEPCQLTDGEVRRGFGLGSFGLVGYEEHIGMTIQEYPEPWNYYTDGWSAHGPVDLINKLISEEYEPLAELVDAVTKELIWASVAIWCAQYTGFEPADSYSEREVHAAFTEWSISKILTSQKEKQETVAQAQDIIWKMHNAVQNKKEKENKEKTANATKQNKRDKIDRDSAIFKAAVVIWPEMGVSAPLRDSVGDGRGVAKAIVKLAEDVGWNEIPSHHHVVKVLANKKEEIFEQNNKQQELCLRKSLQFSH